MWRLVSLKEEKQLNQAWKLRGGQKNSWLKFEDLSFKEEKQTYEVWKLSERQKISWMRFNDFHGRHTVK